MRHKVPIKVRGEVKALFSIPPQRVKQENIWCTNKIFSFSSSIGRKQEKDQLPDTVHCTQHSGWLKHSSRMIMPPLGAVQYHYLWETSLPQRNSFSLSSSTRESAFSSNYWLHAIAAWLDEFLNNIKEQLHTIDCFPTCISSV